MRRAKIVFIWALALSCLAFPALLLPLAMIGYVALGGHGPGFTVAAYGVQIRNPEQKEVPVHRTSQYLAEEAEIESHLRNIHSHRAIAWESARLSEVEEAHWMELKSRLDRDD